MVSLKKIGEIEKENSRMVMNKILLEHVEKALWRIETLEKSIETKTKLLHDANGKVKELEEVILLNTKAKIVLQVLYEKINENGIVELCKLNTMGFNKVFNNKEYEILYDITTERKINNLKFILKEKLDNGKIRKSNIRNAVGGSISSLSGLICLIFFIIKNNGHRFIMLDEAFSEFDAEIIENLFDLLRSFCDKGNFIFVLITHDTRFFDYADKTYFVRDGRVKLLNNAKL